MTLRTRAVSSVGVSSAVGLTVSLAMHALVLILAFSHLSVPTDKPHPSRGQTIAVLVLRPPAPEESAPEPAPATVMADARAERPASVPGPVVDPVVQPATPRQPAAMAAPPAPTAEEWAFASSYKLKNSKGYRYTWGQQVRSMMGTAVEGPDQGMVRFRVEIAPDGSLVSLETLWSTSAAAERLARQAVGSVPRWPPTATGRPLIFEKTISFTPFASDGPPLYKDDCLPDAPMPGNPFAWDGKSARGPAPLEPIEKPDPQALEDCLKQLPKDSIEAEIARDRRLMDQWGWGSDRAKRY